MPNRFIGVVGDHSGDLPVENIALSRDKKFLASCSHDQKIKFWNVEPVAKETVNAKEKAKRGDRNKFLKSSNKSDFFSGLMDDAGPSTSSGVTDDHNDGDDDDDDEWESDSDFESGNELENENDNSGKT